MDVFFYIQLICIFLLSSTHIGHTRKGQKPKWRQSSKKEMEPPRELLHAVQELIHPNAVPNRAMIAIALRHPTSVKQMMEYAPHLINLARKYHAVPPRANGTKRAMTYVKRDDAPKKGRNFKGIELEELPPPTPAPPKRKPRRHPSRRKPAEPSHTMTMSQRDRGAKATPINLPVPVTRRPAGPSHTMTMSQRDRGAKATPINLPVPVTGPVQVGMEPVDQSNLLTKTAITGQTVNEQGTKWTGSPEQTGNQRRAIHKPWSWTNVGNLDVGGHMTASSPTDGTVTNARTKGIRQENWGSSFFF